MLCIVHQKPFIFLPPLCNKMLENQFINVIKRSEYIEEKKSNVLQGKKNYACAVCKLVGISRKQGILSLICSQSFQNPVSVFNAGTYRTFPVLRNVLRKVPLFLVSSVFPYSKGEQGRYKGTSIFPIF